MSNVQQLHLGPDNTPLEQGRSAHGRWRIAFQRASGTPADDGDLIPAAFDLIQDSDRLVFALAEGPAAVYLAGRLADHLWKRESADGNWPENLRDWLADASQWRDAPDGSAVFICGRLERSIAGGRIYLAWLGMNGVRLFKRSDVPVTLDTVLGEGETWTRDNGPEPSGMALHAYRGSLFGLDRLIALSSGAAPLYDDLTDLPGADLQQALEDWGREAQGDLALLDLRLNPVLSSPNTVAVSYRWVSSDQCELHWHPSPNATTYRIEEASNVNFSDASLLAELTDGRQVQYRFSPPTSGPRYYRVTPYNQGVPGEPSNPVNPTPMVLNAPVVQPVEWSTDGGYYLHWSVVPQATSYEVQACESPDFDPPSSQIIYRGDRLETYLTYTDVPPRLYFRARAINVYYAPNTPSIWSEPARSPLRLATPHFIHVSRRKLEWEPVLGARQYAVRVTSPGEDETQGEVVFTRETRSGVADQPGVYRVRALRHPDDQRTASEWSEAVTIAPTDNAPPPRDPNLRGMRALLWIVGVVGLLFGAVAGLIGLQAYQSANATSTPTPFPADVLQVTYSAATLNARYATAVQTTAEFVRSQTAVAASWTATPTATETPTPTITPNLEETIDTEFVNRLTATADEWTVTPTATDTPDLVETIDTELIARLTATADEWTATPTATETPAPTDTPDLPATIEAEFSARLTATATLWTPIPTATPAPTNTPRPTPTDRPTATLSPTETPLPTATPEPTATPDWSATAAALTADGTGCYLINLPDLPLPVYAALSTDSRIVAESAPQLAAVTARFVWPPSGTDSAAWLQVEFADDQGAVFGWVRVPDGAAEDTLYTGPGCPASSD